MRVTVAWNDVGGRAICDSGYYEPDSVALFAALLEPGMDVVDVGANFGQYTLVASGIVGSNGSVHSFEPDPETFQWLRRNVMDNGLANVRLNQTALFRETAQKSLFLAEAHSVGSNSLAGDFWDYAGKTVEVSCIAFDDYLRANRIAKVDLMKLDIEGAELDALRGAEGVLQHSKPILLLEFEEERQRAFGSSCAELAEFLRSHEYALFRVGPLPLQAYRIGPGEPPSLNVLAIESSRAEAVLDSVASKRTGQF